MKKNKSYEQLIQENKELNKEVVLLRELFITSITEKNCSENIKNKILKFYKGRNTAIEETLVPKLPEIEPINYLSLEDDEKKAILELLSDKARNILMTKANLYKKNLKSDEHLENYINRDNGYSETTLEKVLQGDFKEYNQEAYSFALEQIKNKNLKTSFIKSLSNMMKIPFMKTIFFGGSSIGILLLLLNLDPKAVVITAIPIAFLLVGFIDYAYDRNYNSKKKKRYLQFIEKHKALEYQKNKAIEE